MTDPAAPLLELRALRISTAGGTARGTAGLTDPVALVDGVDLRVNPGEVLGLVGESGSGKSLTMAAVTGLLPPGVRSASGQVLWRGEDLLAASSARMRSVRGGEVGMVFQDPARALDPLMRVGAHVVQAIRWHRPEISRREAWQLAIQALDAVGVPDPAQRVRQYPHEFSGGMRQRVMIAIAMVNRPALLIADEPTTALDVTVQAQVLDLLREARRRDGTAVVLITHDLGLIAEIADRVAVMYSGRVVETGTVAELFASPRHPYTRALLASRPHLAARGASLPAIPGQPPSPAQRPAGCAFAPRCAEVVELCASVVPEVTVLGSGRTVRCHRAVQAIPAPTSAPDQQNGAH